MLVKLFNAAWLDIICLLASKSFMETAFTGIGTTGGRGGHRTNWPIPGWLRPIFAVAGFGLLAFVIVDFFRKLLA
jgi:hypothetical protein